MLLIMQVQLEGIVATETLNSPAYKSVFNSAYTERGMTRRMMETSWEKTFPTVQPVAVVLNEDCPDLEWATGNGEPHISKVDAVGYYIPIIPTIQQLLCVSQVRDSVLKSFETIPIRIENNQSITKYSDLWDGQQVKVNSVLMENNSNSLGIQLFYDDAELGNPLGSKKGTNKLAFFYWTLLNLPPKFRSNLRSIMLLGCISTDLLKQYGFHKFLRFFISDMKKLQEGVEFKVGEDKMNLRAFILNSVGDMPASNAFGGFKESASANLLCRTCLASKNELDDLDHECLCILREKTSYLNQVSEIMNEEDENKQKQLTTEYGINRSCVLSLLPYFDATKQFTHDIMHVGFEGVLNLECRLLLDNLTKNNIIDIPSVNYFIKSIQPSREFTRPPPIRENEIKEKKKLSYSSSEMAALCSILPIYIGKYVEATNAYYANFLLLLEIFASLQCYSFDTKELVKLQNNVSRHHCAFLKLYKTPDSQGTITPKLHVLHHFVNQIILFGPPRYSMSFRYESKNAPFKKIMRRNCNFLNVPYTMALFHQRLLGLHIRQDGTGNFFENSIQILNMEKGPRSINKWRDVLLQYDPHLTDCVAHYATKLKMSGRIVSIGTVFLKQKLVESQPLFWSIADVLYVPNNAQTVLIMQELITDYFSEETFSFIVKPSPQCYKAVYPLKVPYDVPLQSFNVENDIHVIPNYYHLL